MIKGFIELTEKLGSERGEKTSKLVLNVDHIAVIRPGNITTVWGQMIRVSEKLEDIYKLIRQAKSVGRPKQN